MSNNFLPFNPNALNQENDAAYNGDSQRSGGAAFNSIFTSPLANKLFYQLSIMVAALAGALTGKGYAPNDGSANPATALTNLQAILANIMTQNDMAPWALLNSPVFTGNPQAPTAAPGDNDASIATTAFVQAAVTALISSFATFSFVGSTGFIKFPLFGHLMLQWFIGSQDGAVEGQFTKNFPFPFTGGTCMGVQVTMGNVPSTQANDAWYQVVSFNATGVTIFKQGTGGTENVSSPYIFAYGVAP